jgi:hypothetical protein
MNLLFTRELKKELADLEQVFKCSLLPWWDSIDDYVKALENDLTWVVLPPVVMSIYTYTGHNRQLAIIMSNIFRNCYLAHRIHDLVKDDEEGQQHNQELQFNILIGDYISGHVLKALVDLQADRLVSFFAEMITEINQGLLIKHKLNGTYVEVVEKTRVPYYTTAFLTAARLAGFDDEICQSYCQMGYHFAMALELGQDSAYSHMGQAHIHECEKIFAGLNKRSNSTNSNLEKAIKELHNHFCSIEQSAVV